MGYEGADLQRDAERISVCPKYRSDHVVRSGRIPNGKQNRRWRGWQFVENPQQNRISEGIKVFINKLLLEKIPLDGIARLCDVPELWMQIYTLAESLPNTRVQPCSSSTPFR